MDVHAVLVCLYRRYARAERNQPALERPDTRDRARRRSPTGWLLCPLLRRRRVLRARGRRASVAAAVVLSDCQSPRLPDQASVLARPARRTCRPGIGGGVLRPNFKTYTDCAQ